MTFRPAQEPNPPRVSVLVSARDAERTIAEALASLAGQTFADFECLVFDDGSADRTAEIAAGFAAADTRFRVLRRAARGLTPTLREGVELARAELLARMDADDVARPERFARQVAYLDAHPDCVALGCDVLLVDPERRPIGPYGVPAGHAEIEARLLSGEGGALFHPSLMARRAAVIEAGSYRLEFSAAQDLDLYLRLAERGRLANLPEVLLEYRHGSVSVSQARREEQHACALAIVREAHERRGLAAPTAIAEWPAHGAETWRRWSQMALGTGNVATARRYARAAWRSAPSAEHALLLVRALLGVRLGWLRAWLGLPLRGRAGSPHG